MIRMTAVAAVAALGLLAPVQGDNIPLNRPPENPACVPLARTITHWVRVLDRHPSPARFYAAAVAVDDFTGPATPRLNRWVFDVGNGFQAESIGWDFRTDIREGLRHIRVLCPSLPASVAEGRLPR